MTATAAHTAVRTPVRPEIQALRALAVTLVVVVHHWGFPPAGSVGVDVFFVISGYLITAQLVREATSTGRLALLPFWGRRIRRLLPAALVTLLFVLVTALAFWPRADRPTILGEVVASAFSVENWALLARFSSSPGGFEQTGVTHFWSLSVEEQFYLAWPLVILVALAIAAVLSRRRAFRRDRAIAIAVAVVLVASLASWIVLTVSGAESAAYLMTPARAWEFAAGGLLVFAPRLVDLRMTDAARAALHGVCSWGGLALIVGGAVWPGMMGSIAGIVLPVAGTILVIWAETLRRWWSPTSLGALRPVQFLGDVSYGVYLWHWPILLAYIAVRGDDLSLRTQLVLVAAAVLAGWLSKRFIEDPFRRSAMWRPLPRTYAFAAASAGGIVLIVALATAAGAV